jgi:GNAT superfamily N-acetyltransferase
MNLTCFECEATVEADDLTELGNALLAHARANHEWPFSDQDIRNYGEATQRLTGPTDRLPALGAVEIHPVTEDRLDDWAGFFDHDAFVGKPEWAACYCIEPHAYDPARERNSPHWSENREAMLARLRAGTSFGYLAYVDGRPAAWANASKRGDYSPALFRRGPGSDPPDEAVVGVSCFIVAPPYRRHGLAAQLLDRVLADAPGRGVAWVEGYPFKEAGGDDAPNFRGPRSIYEARGFEQVAERERDVVMRRRV